MGSYFGIAGCRSPFSITHCAGISVGLVMSTEDTASEQSHALLLDIMGNKDYYGDMDFKVAE